jgi:hypothetical protein
MSKWLRITADAAGWSSGFINLDHVAVLGVAGSGSSWYIGAWESTDDPDSGFQTVLGGTYTTEAEAYADLVRITQGFDLSNP